MHINKSQIFYHQEHSLENKNIPGNLKNRGFKSKSMDIRSVRKAENHVPMCAEKNWLFNTLMNSCMTTMTVM